MPTPGPWPVSRHSGLLAIAVMSTGADQVTPSSRLVVSQAVIESLPRPAGLTTPPVIHILALGQLRKAVVDQHHRARNAIHDGGGIHGGVGEPP